MGRLAGFSHLKVVRVLRKFGFVKMRQTGSHEGWQNDNTRRKVSVPKHRGDIPEGTLRAILKQAGITPDEFLDG